jgi:hypothetical protein
LSRGKLLIIHPFHCVEVGKVIHARAITGPTPAIVAQVKILLRLYFFGLHLNQFTQGVAGVEVGVRAFVRIHITIYHRFARLSRAGANFFETFFLDNWHAAGGRPRAHCQEETHRAGENKKPTRQVICLIFIYYLFINALAFYFKTSFS